MTEKIPVQIVLEKGALLEGRGWGDFSNYRSGEFVFSTAMSGIEESLTDPSFAKQVLVNTVSHVGNTGINLEDHESSKMWAEGLICRHVETVPSSWRSRLSLPTWIQEQKKFLVDKVDTRKLTIFLRETGSQRGLVFPKGKLSIEAAQKYILENVPSMASLELSRHVSCEKAYDFTTDTQAYWPMKDITRGQESSLRPKVLVWDFGVKTNTLRWLHYLGLDVSVLPATAKAEDFLSTKASGILLSNGPGDPGAATFLHEELKKLLGRIPIFGICMGHQLLGIALGAKTRKMKFGHRGIHHPVVQFDKARNPLRTWITSQNHGFEVEEASLPSNVWVSFRHADDQSVEGLEAPNQKCFSVQFHPESAPGPFDCFDLFKRFQEEVVNYVSR
jgi:carbamoyl-phosphate synthase small subunit